MLKISVLAISLMFCATTFAYSQGTKESIQTLIDNSDFLEALPQVRALLVKESTNMEVLEQAAIVYSELEIKDTALMYSKRLYEDDNDNLLYLDLYTKALIATNSANEATIILRKKLKKKNDVNVSLMLVDALLAADSLAPAELVATTAKNNNKSNAGAYLALGNLYFNYKPLPVYELAQSNYEEAIKLNDKLLQAHFNLAQCYWKMANRESDDNLANEYFKRSLIEWNKVTQQDPKNARAWFEQGKIFFLAKKYKEATGALTKYRELRPVGTGEPLASWYLGSSYFKLNDCGNAKKHLTDAAQLIDTVKLQASLQMARCYFLTKDYTNAVSNYSLATPKKSAWESIDLWYYGAATVLTGDTTKALSIMSEAAIADPKQCVLMYRFGVLLSQKKDFKKSTEIFRARLANCNDSLDARAYTFIGNNYFADSNVVEAIAAYEKSVSINPKFSYALQRLGETQIASGDEVKGRATLQQVIDLGVISTNQDDKRAATSAIIRLNNLDMKAKLWQDIINRSKSGTALDPQNSTLWLFLGIGYQGLADKENACKAYKECLRLDPTYENAKNNIKALKC